MTKSNADGLRFDGATYGLVFPDDRPFVYLNDASGQRVAELFVPPGVHTLGGLDDTTAVGPWEVEESGDATVFSVRLGSSVWREKRVSFRCRPERLTFEVTVMGDGALADVTYFGGYSSAFPRWGSGFFPSGNRFMRGFNPEPNTAGEAFFDPVGGTVVDLTGGPLPGKRHWFFNPAPFCLGFQLASGGWLGFGVEAESGAWRFSEYRYHGGTGFWLSLSYDGMTRVDGEYRLPAIGIDFGMDEFEVLGKHVSSVLAGTSSSEEASRADTSGASPYGSEAGQVTQSSRPDWWARPIFCGWGAQCGLSAAAGGYALQDPERPDWRSFLAALKHAGEYARQDVYDGFVHALDHAGLDPGTVVLDDKWQATYGENLVDEQKWPDLRGFIDRRHAEGRHVLLWLKAWDREGVPDGECITNAAGLPLAVDPTNPAFERRLCDSVRRMVSPEGYDADGFKIDFTHRIPVGPGLRLHGELWGLELLRHYLCIIRDEAKRWKPDALIMAHTPHPAFNGVVDMIRLNDMLDITEMDDPDAGRDIGRTLELRARVAAIGCPNALIDTDNWPVRNRAVWREYVRLQPRLGVPSLYFATQIDLTREPLEEDDYTLIREAWAWFQPT